MRFLGIFAVVIAVWALAAQAATSAHSRVRATRFAVSVRGTFTKEWTYTRSSSVNGCAARVHATGTRTVKLRTTDVPLVFGRWPGGAGRARFSGAIRVAAAISQSGTKTTTISAGPACEASKHEVTCARVNRTYTGKTTGLVSRRLHRLGLLPIGGLVTADFLTSCPGEPRNVRAVSVGLELGDATYAEKILFARTTAGLSLQGRADVTTQLGGGTGTVVQHVRLTLVLRHVG